MLAFCCPGTAKGALTGLNDQASLISLYYKFTIENFRLYYPSFQSPSPEKNIPVHSQLHHERYYSHPKLNTKQCCFPSGKWCAHLETPISQLHFVWFWGYFYFIFYSLELKKKKKITTEMIE